MTATNDQFPHRLRRLDHVWLHDGEPTYFLTLCTAGRARRLATPTVHDRMRIFLADSLERYGWWVACYVLMPDHLHLFARAKTGAVTLGSWVKALKVLLAQREFRWQAGYFDHVLRSAESQSEKWGYVCNNPVRAGLVPDAAAWPYWGAFHPDSGKPL